MELLRKIRHWLKAVNYFLEENTIIVNIGNHFAFKKKISDQKILEN